jgi:23S rRNA (uridine2552-2'-O)-methyltransferase
MARYQYRDRFYRKAEQQGLPSRAAFKLEELLNRFELIGEGARVVDLGSAPGGWLAILARKVGARGRVVGVDLVACPAPTDSTVTLIGDVRSQELHRRTAQALAGAADLVTSDMAPKLSGIAERDQASSRELVEAALELGRSVLKPGGAMIAKVFMGSEFEETRRLFSRDFLNVSVVRTRASRPGSSELYFVARDFQKVS